MMNARMRWGLLSFALLVLAGCASGLSDADRALLQQSVNAANDAKTQASVAAAAATRAENAATATQTAVQALGAATGAATTTRRR